MKYRFELRIDTLANNAVMRGVEPPAFDVGDLHFIHWDFNHRDGWPSNAWLVTSEIDAQTFDDAYRTFWIPVDRISARVGFISQCYTEHRTQPLLVARDDLAIAFFKYVRPRGSVPLMFT